MNRTSLLVFIGFSLLLLFVYLFYRIKKRLHESFKIVIENGYIAFRTDNVPAEFLYDVQQIARIEKLPALVIIGTGLKTDSPQLIFKGDLSAQLKQKIQHSLMLSLQ